jgi:tyrosine phenol-lyase
MEVATNTAQRRSRRVRIMTAEPYKNKEIKHLPKLEPYERWNILKAAAFNTYNVASDFVSFDMVAKGMSSWSHFQKAGLMIGDEAYAGSRNFYALEDNARRVLGVGRIVPTHNGIGAEKLLAVTMCKKGQLVPTNRGRNEGLVPAVGGVLTDVTDARAAAFGPPSALGASLDLGRLEKLLSDKSKVAYVYLEACPDAWNGQPMAVENLEKASALCRKAGVPLALDASNAVAMAYWNIKTGEAEGGLLEVVRRMTAAADVVLVDASQDCRSDVGGFISSANEELWERFRNEVVLYEGLHTYGGMTGRAMEVFAVGIAELEETAYTEWYMSQLEQLHGMLAARGVPSTLGTRGVGLEIGKFLPHLGAADHPKFVLAASLYLCGGIRPRIDGGFAYHESREGSKVLNLELPRHAYTRAHLEHIADVVAMVYENRAEISGLVLKNAPEFIDEAVFDAANHRLFVTFPKPVTSARLFEPYKIAIFEPIKVTDKADREKAMAAAGYNTFLLESEDVYIDFLTDSGTTAMSGYQWEGMTNSTDTPYSSRHFADLVEEFQEILGFEHIIPTHQGRAAEHIMSQSMIKPGQYVPGNMYFTTTKAHQEMAGGIFVDVIVDEAHDPASDYPWKGNIDLGKLQAVVDKAGPGGVAYVSFEITVNMAGGQPVSMENARDVARLCQKHGIPVMWDATRCVENAQMIKLRDPAYANSTVEAILRELMSYGDGCTISCKKDFMVNMGGLLACNNDELAHDFRRMLRVWEGDVTTGGLDPKDIEALRRGLLDSLDDDYIAMRVEQTQRLGRKLMEAGVPIVTPPGTHAIFLNAKKFLPHIDQEEYPAQALSAAIYIETGVRTMERGNVSKGRDPSGNNYKPALELVRLTIPRRVYTDSHFDFVVEGIKRLYEKRDKISGLKFVYEPHALRFFQGRFEPLAPWKF